ncbi:unnamed protein product [Peronospora belbahrii]|uniref:Copper transporter n=1 Tax=Peronospora belbahrii TaxID=622444 RepID=A0AAU9KS65_9STRA|nr:unnamed protein product [Peronospora belbahrii]CAH0519978.1 unnamed protein product [Peronospora belbahrii]
MTEDVKVTAKNAKGRITAKTRFKTMDKSKQNAKIKNTLAEDGGCEDRPFVVRFLTVGVASYLAQKVWTKRKMMTHGWYTEEMTETEIIMVIVFEYMSSMGLIFIIGIVVGKVVNMVAKWVRGIACQRYNNRVKSAESCTSMSADTAFM